MSLLTLRGVPTPSLKTRPGPASPYPTPFSPPSPPPQGSTSPPPLLAERDLISAMERHGIGTDATVAEHIQKQLDRGYAVKDAALRFGPTALGEALISAYR